MSKEPVRSLIPRLKASAASKSLIVPEGMDAGLYRANEQGQPLPVEVDGLRFKYGVSAQDAADQAARHYVRMDDAVQAYEAERDSLLQDGAPRHIADFQAARALDDVAEIVRRSAIEAAHDPRGTVIADVAAALTAMRNTNPAAAEMVLRRAGNPEVFMPIVQAKKVPEYARFDEGAQSKAADSVTLDRALTQAEKSVSRKELPLIGRPASHFGKPETVNAQGKIVRDTKAFKNYVPKDHDPLNTDTTLIIQDEETGAWRPFDYRRDTARRSEAVFAGDMEASTQKQLLEHLAKDQLAQVKAIEGSKEPTGRIATLRKVRTKKGEPEVTKDTLTVGAGSSPDAPWQQGRRDPVTGTKIGVDSPPGDMVVDFRNKGVMARVYDAIDRAADSRQTFDVSKVIPWVWARVGEIGDDGKSLIYPNQMKSAEWVMEMVLGMYKFPNPEDLRRRWFDTIQRSLDAMPDTPDAKAPPGGGRSAAQWAGMVFVPNASFRKAMEKGLGSENYPFKIYGPRKVKTKDVEPPSTEPIQPGEAGERTKAIQERIRRRREAGPGSDKVSINREYSPLGGLLA